ncbi:MAG: purine-nucleoside phosphorylase [Clostridiales bacterium]|nr:purine-nucleoside phosphorylase [Clostridiales bacterium]
MFGIAQYNESASFIKERLSGFAPEFLLVLGSGLGFLGDEVEGAIHVPYGDIPHFKQSTAPGHAGRFAFGVLAGRKVAVMQGRLHMYEGHGAEDVVYPVRVARLIGASSMVVTNACGGVNTSFGVGEIILLRDIIKFSGLNPLSGPNLPEFGSRFTDMSRIFDPEYAKIIKRIGETEGQEIKDGVYFYMTGPQYETPAEIRAIRILGGDLVGMSTAPECLAARHMGMRTLGLSLVTNMAAGVLDQPLSEEEVLREAEKAKARFSRLVLGFLKEADAGA